MDCGWVEVENEIGCISEASGRSYAFVDQPWTGMRGSYRGLWSLEQHSLSGLLALDRISEVFASDIPPIA
jgi:hypothetical protein